MPCANTPTFQKIFTGELVVLCHKIALCMQLITRTHLQLDVGSIRTVVANFQIKVTHACALQMLINCAWGTQLNRWRGN